MSYPEIVERNLLVEVGDSHVLRTLRQLTGKNVDNSELNSLLELRARLRKSKESKAKDKLLFVQEKLTDLLFVKEYVSLHVDDDEAYSQINENGVVINGVEYVRLFCSSGGARNDTAVFVDKRIYPELDKVLSNDANEIELSPAKFSPYYALCSSSSIPVTHLDFTVVPDLEVNRETRVEYIVESDTEGIDDIVDERIMDLPFNLWDGMGIISPDGAEQWARDLGLDYIPSAFCIRNAYLKGMVCTFDFHQFLEEIPDANYMVNDIWGKNTNLKNVDLIITGSQLKLWKAYDSLKHYQSACNKNGFRFSVTKVTPKTEKNFTNLNYQFVQATNQNHRSVIKLCQPTVEYLNKILFDDPNYLKIYAMNSATEHEYGFDLDMFKRIPIPFRALLIDEEMLNDKYVKDAYIKSLNKKIRDTYIGVIMVKGNYQVAISDPYAFMEYVSGLPVKGLLNNGQHYSAYWNKFGDKTVVAMRAPLTWRSEVNKLNLVENELVKKWYKYLDSGIVYNVFGVDCMLQADSDDFIVPLCSDV